MSDRYYILDGHMPVACDMVTWARWLESRKNRHVAEEVREGVRVSTAFLGLNHQFGEGPPLIFETMIFGGDEDQYMDRCSTWEEAEAMHAEACKLAWPEEANDPPKPGFSDDEDDDSAADDAHRGQAAGINRHNRGRD